MDKILSIECVEKASKFLTEGLTRILDTLAPLKTVQTQSNYAPHILEETKDLQRQRGGSTTEGSGHWKPRGRQRIQKLEKLDSSKSQDR